MTLWAKQFGTMENEQGRGVVVARDGSVIVVGSFSGTLTLEGKELTSAGSTDIYVMKLASSTGMIMWTRRFGGEEFDVGNSAAVDEDDNIYVTGSFESAVDFGGALLTSASSRPDGFLLKLTPNGDLLWAKQIGGFGHQSATSISVSGPMVIVGGVHEGMTTVDATTVTAKGVSDFFVLSTRSQDGAANWLRSFGGDQIESASSVAIDNTGNVVVAAMFQGIADFGGGPLSSQNGTDDIVLLKLSATNGAHLFSKRLGGMGQDQVARVTTDPDNNILITGAFNAVVDLGCPDPLTASESQVSDIFLAKYSQAGACLWAKGFGGTGGALPFDRYGRAVIVNRPGEVAVAGHFCGAVSFGGPTLVSASECPQGDIFVARFSGADGSYLNSVRAGGTGYETANGVAHSADGRLFVTGWFTGFAEFGKNALASVGGEDAFVIGLSL